jgi:hypothetical protein
MNRLAQTMGLRKRTESKRKSGEKKTFFFVITTPGALSLLKLEVLSPIPCSLYHHKVRQQTLCQRHDLARHDTGLIAIYSRAQKMQSATVRSILGSTVNRIYLRVRTPPL